MKFLTNIKFISIVWLSLANFAFAAAAPTKTFSIYMINNTPYKATVGASNYSKTPVNFEIKEVQTNAKPMRIGTGEIVNGKANVSIYARLGDERNYRNTPLFTYKLTDIGDCKLDNCQYNHLVAIDPYAYDELPFIFADGKKYRAHAYYFVDSEHGDNNALMILFEPALV